MAAKTIPDYPRGITFEQVWAAIMEDRENIEKRKIEFDREMREQKEKAEIENRKQIEKTELEIRKHKIEFEHEKEKSELDFRKYKEENDRMIKRLNEQMGGLHNSFGELAEHLVAPGIVERFNKHGYHFDAVAINGMRILDGNGGIKTEIDLLLENDNFIIAVEIKSKQKEKDIEHHINRLKILREHRDKHGDKRKVRGALAGAVFPSEIKDASLAAGLYVLEQSGDTMKMELPSGFTPKEW